MEMPIINDLVGFLSRGKNNAITARAIAEHFGVSDGGADVPIRTVIRHAIEDGQLIGSTSQGFFIIENETELNEYVVSLESRRSEIATRIANLHRSWDNQE